VYVCVIVWKCVSNLDHNHIEAGQIAQHDFPIHIVLTRLVRATEAVQTEIQQPKL
jgi:hypothetical protein